MSAGNNRDFIIDLRMRADVGSARKAIQQTESDLEALSDTARKASSDAANVGTGQSAAGSGIEQQAEAQRQYLLQSRMAQQAIADEIRLIGQLGDRLSGSASSMEELADTEAMVDRAMARGLISAEEYDDALASLNRQQGALDKSLQAQGKSVDDTVRRYDKAGAQLQKLAADETRLKQAYDAGRVSKEQYDRAMGNITARRKEIQAIGDQAAALRRLNLGSSGTQRDLSQLLSYAATGNWQLAGNQVLQLGNRAGIAELAFSGLGAAVGGTAIVLGTLVVAAIKGYSEMRALETALLAAGNTAGVTTGQLMEMADAVGRDTGEYGKAQEAAALFAQSGRVAGDSLQDMIGSAVSLSELTRKSVEQTSQELLRVTDAPVKGLMDLDRQYHFLTASTLQQVRALADQGNEQEAVRVGLRELSDVSAVRVKQMQEDVAGLARRWAEASRGVAGYWNDLKRYANAVWNPTLENQIAMLESRIASPDAGANYKRAAAAQLASLKQQKAAQDELAAGAAFADDLRRQGVEAVNDTADALKEARAPAEKLADAIKDVQKRYQTLRREVELGNADDSILEGVLFHADGTVSGGNYDKEVAALGKKYKDPKPKKTDAQKADEAAKRELDNLYQRIDALQNLEEGEKKVADAERIRFEVESGAFKDASPKNKALLQDVAQLLDGEQRRVDAARKYVDVQVEIARLQGRPVPPELDLENKKLDRQIKQWEAYGQTAEAAAGRQVQSLRAAAHELESVGILNARLASERQMREQTLQTQVELGLKTEAQARQELLALYKQQADVIRSQVLPAMESVYATMQGTPAGDQLLAQIEQLRLKLQELDAYARGGVQRGLDAYRAGIEDMSTTVANAVQNGLGGLEDYLTSALSHGKTSFHDFTESVLADLARIIVRQGIVNSLISAMKSSYAGTQGSSSTTGTLTSLFAGAWGFEGGGYTGPGARNKVAGLVHAGEGVLNQDEIRALGGPAGFEAFRTALQFGYGKGGFVSFSGQSPAPVAIESMAAQPSVEVNITNESGTAMQADVSSVRLDGDRYIVGVVAKAIAGGDLDQPLQLAGMGRRTGTRYG